MISVPKDVSLDFLKLADLSAEVMVRITESLGQISVSSNQTQQVRACISSFSDVFDPTETADIAGAIQSLHIMYARYGGDPTQFLRELCDSVFRFAPPDFNEQTKSALDLNLRALLDVRSLQVGHKAALLQVEHGRVFTNARILTDIRPVFSEPVEEGPLASALVIHTLKIEYWESGDQKSFFVALDAEDIQTIYEQVERAKLKEKRLRAEISERLSVELFDSSGG